MAVSAPVAAFIVPTEVGLLLHVPPAVALESVIPVPAHIETPPPAIAAGAGCTVKITVAVPEGPVKEIVAVPGDTPFTVAKPEPVATTVAIAVLLLFQVALVLVESTVVCTVAELPTQVLSVPIMAAYELLQLIKKQIRDTSKCFFIFNWFFEG
jgi:predicted lysophospholipase L1 biosynthesis ABC-type transport system permease subunit